MNESKKFSDKAKIIHNNKYDYSLINYVNSKTKIKIICPKHGIFEQTPLKHLNNQGCPICKESKGEKEIKKYLLNNKIKFEIQKSFKNCKYKSLLKFDFYLPEHNICIEYDGKQHFEIIDYWGGKVEYDLIKIRDNIKTDYCNKNNIKLIRIKYNEIITEKLNFLIK